MRYLTLVVIVLSGSACATVTTSQEMGTKVLGEGYFSWEWTQGTGGPAEKFHMHCVRCKSEVDKLISCEKTAEAYTPIDLKEARTDTSGVWKYPVGKVITKTGAYSCHVRAWNESAGPSDKSNTIDLLIVEARE